MKKHILICLSVFFAAGLTAEEMPEGYYANADGKKDAELKTALSNICKGGSRYKYGTRDLNTMLEHYYTWDGFLQTDTKEDGTVWDMYSTRIHYMAQDTYGAVSIPDLEIEHCFPKSWWGGDNNDAYKDLYHLNPSNSRANNNKSAYPPGYVPTADKYENDIFRMGKNSAYGDFFVFEPCDEYKGDFARAYFYVATAYEDLTWAADASDYLDNSSYLEFRPWLQQVLLEWHRLDPVSEKEIVRQDRVSNIQHNRNPYIDYPGLVEYIWGDKQHTAVDFSTLTFTGSEDYQLPVETLGNIAREADGITEEGFTAQWRNRGTDNYTLEVFRLNYTSRNDTLLSVPVFHSSVIKADAAHFSYTGSFGTTGVGKSSVTFGTKTNPLKLTIQGLTIPADTRITVRAMAPMKINDTEGAQLKISADGSQIALQTLTFDETYYTFSIPQGTQNIMIEQGNGKLFNMQQMYIYSGNLTSAETPVEGYPVTVTGLSHRVETSMPEGETVYYRVTPEGMQPSNTIAVCRRPHNPTGNTSERLSDPAALPQKVIIGNGLYIRMPDGSLYSVSGIKLR